jgi:hypothetical protein
VTNPVEFDAILPPGFLCLIVFHNAQFEPRPNPVVRVVTPALVVTLGYELDTMYFLNSSGIEHLCEEKTVVNRHP